MIRLAAIGGLLLLAGNAMLPAEGEARIEPQVMFMVQIEPKRGGDVLCALYRHERNWLSRTTFRSAKTSVKNPWATCKFPRVPKGNYAIAALHDEDRDGEMDKFLGLPLEGYAASRDAHFKGIGAPDWEDALFTHDQVLTLQRARMKY